MASKQIQAGPRRTRGFERGLRDPNGARRFQKRIKGSKLDGSWSVKVDSKWQLLALPSKNFAQMFSNVAQLSRSYSERNPWGPQGSPEIPKDPLRTRRSHEYPLDPLSTLRILLDHPENFEISLYPLRISKNPQEFLRLKGTFYVPRISYVPQGIF